MMISKKHEEALFQALKTSANLVIGVSQASEISTIPKTDLKKFGEQSELFEFVKANAVNGPAYVLRARCNATALLHLLPVKVSKLEHLYRDTGSSLESTITALVSQGKAYIHDDILFASDSPSESNRVPVPALEDTDVRVLNHLEDLEENRINYGLYETFVTPAEIIQRSGDYDNHKLGQHQVEQALLRLVANGLVIEIKNRYRSRISEIVRLLKYVKQRFAGTPIQEAPYLIQSLQVRFRNREQLRRSRTFQATLNKLRVEYQSHATQTLPTVIDAVEQGFSRVVGLPPQDTGLTRVQERSLEQIARRYLNREGGGFVITGNTGSGKTEAALLPLLIGAAQERLAGIRGCKILLIYPRQALAKNQLQRIIEYCAAINDETSKKGNSPLSVGIAFGDTPNDPKELLEGKHGGNFSRGGWQAKEGGFVIPYFQDANGEPVLVHQRSDRDWAVEPASRAWRFDNFRATRRDIQEDPPDILVLTTEMLHRWLSNPAYNAFFGLPQLTSGQAPFGAPRAIVLDEIHLYDTTHGAQVGMLLRRLRHRLALSMKDQPEKGWRNPLVVGMSATIGNPGAFWSQLSGVPLSQVTEILPAQEDLERLQGREYFIFIRPETYSRGKHVGDASTAIQSIMTIAHNMLRRAPTETQDGKFRSLVFQDSIGKIKKLALEYYDAETNKKLALLRTNALPSGEVYSDPLFLEGEYWWFEAQDSQQYSGNRQNGGLPVPLTSTERPIFSGTGGRVTELLQRDIIFATSALEVGYDDPSIQFVLQHRAPRNPASFIQKKGRAGRSLNDRPITAITLSQRSFKDAFYYQNPALLTDPNAYVPPLNVDNHFIQRFQTLALIFDTIAAHRRQIPDRHPSLQSHLAVLDNAFADPTLARRIDEAFRVVTTETFRRTVGNWRNVWDEFKQSLEDAFFNYAPNNVRTSDLLTRSPELPKNLFSTINLPVVQVMSPPAKKGDEWPIDEEDIALAFSEIAPGRVTRRYGGQDGRRQYLHWRPLHAKVGDQQTYVRDAIAVERYKPAGKRLAGKPGPFNPVLLQHVDQEAMWGLNWEQYLPKRVWSVYNNVVPKRFYRTRYIELWSYGSVPYQDPRRPGTDWVGIMESDGRVTVQYKPPGGSAARDPRERTIDPNSNSYPLSFSVVRPHQGAQPNLVVHLPPLFQGLLDSFEFFCGERAAVRAWEVHYGAEAQVGLLSKKRDDKEAGLGFNSVRYISEHDGEPTFYGYDLVTEGFRASYNPDVLQDVSEQIFLDIWREDKRRTHLQDQYLRYLLKSTTWPVTGLSNPINTYDQRHLGDIIATLRAATRDQGMDLTSFITNLGERQKFQEFALIAKFYGYDQRIFTDEFFARAHCTLESPRVQGFLKNEIFAKLTSKEYVTKFLSDTLVHSLKHAARNLFLTEGSTRDEEVGSHAILDILYGHEASTPAFYLYERNRGGNGSTRSAAQRLQELSPESLIRLWWDASLSCPVGDEEAFIKSVLRRTAPPLRELLRKFFETPIEDRQPLGEELETLLKREIGPHPIFSRTHPMVRSLSGLLTSELSLGGKSVKRYLLQLELLQLEDELSQKFQRAPTSTELAGFALSRIETPGSTLPELMRLRGLYEEHAASLERVSASTEADTELGWRDRLLAQIGHLGLSSCQDACPACLAARCDLGHIDTTRHTLSRYLLKLAYRHLTGDLSVDDTIDSAIQARVKAEQHAGYVLLRKRGEVDPNRLRPLRHEGFVTASVIFDYDELETHTIMKLDPQ